MSDTHDKAMTIVERAPVERAGMTPVMATALEILRQNPSPETLQKLLELDREYQRDEAKKAYDAALVALKRDLPRVIAHDKTVDFVNNSGKRTNYTHASLAAVMEAVTEPLTTHGFALTWHPSTGKDGVTVTCRLTHAAGHYEEVSLSAPPDTSGSKSPPQAVASTITLLERRTATSLLGIATADMTEPVGDGERTTDPGKVDSQRNLAAVGKMKKRGKTVEQAVALIGRPVAEWTDADLRRLDEWSKPPAKDVKHATDCGVNAPGGGGACDCGAK